jgi:glycogen operon protein
MHRTDPPEPGAVPGATATAAGTTFVLSAPDATAVTLALFDSAGRERRVPLERAGDGHWSTRIVGLGPGALYGFRVDGPFDPAAGLWFNPQKLLIDPRARAIAGRLAWSDLLLPGRENEPGEPDPRDSAGAVPKAVVIGNDFDWTGDHSPATPWDRTVIYECHVGGMTALHPAVPERLRGTFLGLSAPPVIEHLLALGVTAVQLLPVHQSVTDRRLAALGLTNYWGYNTIGYFAPDARFATGCHGEQVNEFRSMVLGFHRAGIEVLLDVVFNHTGEGDHEGPLLTFRGSDNRGVYRLDPIDRSRYVDYTGVGNTVHAGQSAALSLILDSLRYWVRDMHVDGFRFDLATTLGRSDEDFDAAAPFFESLRADPVLSRVKLIAEPWDLGPDGYRLGAFPPGWSEWNDRFRDAARRFWAGMPDRAGELERRIAGSPDLLPGRAPFSSINFVTCHDGFTLRDLVSYERKHNEANLEHNRDGHHENLSRNWGTEGPTEDAGILRARAKASQGLFALLALSQGVPMLSHGDEIGRTQSGNNNAYCQDGPLTWVSWKWRIGDQELLEHVRALFRLRASHPGFREGGGMPIWLDAEAAPIDPEVPTDRVTGYLLAGPPRLLVLMNGQEEPRQVRLPGEGAWKDALGFDDTVRTGELALEGFGVAVLVEV